MTQVRPPLNLLDHPAGKGSALVDRAPRGFPPGGAHYVRLPGRGGWVLEGEGTMGPGAPGAACGRLVTDGGRFPTLNKLCAATGSEERSDDTECVRAAAHRERAAG